MGVVVQMATTLAPEHCVSPHARYMCGDNSQAVQRLSSLCSNSIHSVNSDTDNADNTDNTDNTDDTDNTDNTDITDNTDNTSWGFFVRYLHLIMILRKTFISHCDSS